MAVKLKLKVLWAKNSLGLSIDQVCAQGNSPLICYYFWPKTKAWEQLELELNFKSWIAEEEKIKILNTAAEVMNFWRKNRHNETVESVSNIFSDVNVVQLNT
jgi:30S ribosomal protein 3